jgi:hypothetical protein
LGTKLNVLACWTNVTVDSLSICVWLLFNLDTLPLILVRRSQSNAELQCIVKCTDNDRPVVYQPVLHRGHGLLCGRGGCLDMVWDVLWHMVIMGSFGTEGNLGNFLSTQGGKKRYYFLCATALWNETNYVIPYFIMKSYVAIQKVSCPPPEDRRSGRITLVIARTTITQPLPTIQHQWTTTQATPTVTTSTSIERIYPKTAIE